MNNYGYSNIHIVYETYPASICEGKNQGDNPKQHCNKIERRIKALKDSSGEADLLKRAIERIKIAAKESIKEVKQWNDQIEEKITRADDNILRLKECFEKAKREENQKIQKEELDYERKLFEMCLKFQTRPREVNL